MYGIARAFAPLLFHRRQFAELYTLRHLILESSSAGLLWFGGSLLLLSLLFAPPRLWYWWKAPAYTSLIAFAALLLGASAFIVGG
jgi:hypothetical protein